MGVGGLGNVVHTAGGQGDQQGVRARVRAAGKALEGDDGHKTAPLYHMTRKTKAL